MPPIRRLALAVALATSALAAGAAGAAGVSAAGAVAPAYAQDAPAYADTNVRVPVRAEPDGTAVDLDATLTLPNSPGPHPALLLAHGFGGSKADLADEAHRQASRGYAVLWYSARGFGASGGRIHLLDPDYEVADARRLLDLLAARTEVAKDGANDPRVGVVGGSYGGATALMVAATDPRVDTVVAAITWNDLAKAFFPNAVGPTPGLAGAGGVGGVGPLKQLWANRFIVSAAASSPSAGPSAGANATPNAGPNPAGPLCGRFDPTVCRLFLNAADTATASPELLAMLRAHSPSPMLANLRAPTLLVQGMADSLFGLDQADATAAALKANGTPFAMYWTDGGHDGPSSTADADRRAADTWLDDRLRGTGTRPPDGTTGIPAFTYAGTRPRRAPAAPLFTMDGYPGIRPMNETPLKLKPLAAGGGGFVSPPGGQPASLTTVPQGGGLGGLTLPGWQLAALPGQFAAFDTEPAPQRIEVLGSPKLTLRVTSSAADATLFVSLWQVTGETATLPRRLVAPVRIATVPGHLTEVEVALPAAGYTVEAGSTWRVLVSSTDGGFAVPRAARAYTVTAVGDLILPRAGAAVRIADTADRESQLVGAALVALLVLLAALALRRGRRTRHTDTPPDTRHTDTPPDRGSADPASPAGPHPAAPVLEVAGLVKTYADGHRAVDGVSWTVERGQIVGLLGANGAGKTTTMRMLVGLIEPDEGSVRILGEPVDRHAQHGTAVLARVGALIEGPGFMPHRSGRENLIAYWAAAGHRLYSADLDGPLDVAALGDAVDRTVRSYSHGMRQRLGIAQAMLGRPELLLLDEPTNGLDPPQIAAMRGILRRYADAGGTVVVSSHLLAEVEQTCTHVVVMDRGRVVLAGPVDALRGERRLEDVVLGTIAAQRGFGDGTTHDDEVLREVRRR